MVFSGYEIAISLIAIMLAVSGIILGLGYALNDRRLKEFGSAELYQSIINGAVIGVIFVTFVQGGFLTGLINGISGITTQPHCSAASQDNYAICFALNNIAGESVVNGVLLTGAVGLYMVLATLSSIQIGFSFIITVSMSLTAFKVFLGPLQEIIDFLFANVILLQAQQDLLIFISYTAIPLILPTGLILRTFYFTRSLGGALIAIAIGLFVVLPLTYVFDTQLVQTASAGSSNNTVGNLLNQINSTKLAALNFQNTLSTGTSNVTNSTNSSIAWSSYNMLTSDVALAASPFSAALNSLEDWVASAIIQVILFPLFNLILTIISMRELARILGSEVSLGRFDIF